MNNLTEQQRKELKLIASPNFEDILRTCIFDYGV
jgi:hypothetical protein